VKQKDPTNNTSLPPDSSRQKKMNVMNHLLVVDDDRDLVELLREYLVPEGFQVDAAYDQSSGLREALKGEHELVVLDVMLPGGSGFELLKQLRTTSELPVLLLTARGDAVDRIVGLEIGADDYLPKPFDPRELVARIRAILRRTRSATEEEGERDEITVGDVSLFISTRTVTLEGEPVELTTVEFNILEVLMKHAGKVVPREELAQVALGRPLAAFDRSVDVHVSKLRRKLGGGEESENRIKTVRGSGYIYAASPSEH
jgi:two-component system response regulator CpxR